MRSRMGAPGLLLLAVATTGRGGSLTTIIDNGPSTNRVDVVFLGDGYTADDIAAGVYQDHIHKLLNYMFEESLNADPFPRYRDFFNIHVVEVVSNESGADIPPDGIFRDTALDASYYFDGDTKRLLSVSTSKANSFRNAALAGTGFSAEMQFVTVNHTMYGGAGGGYAVYAGGSSSARELALHEVAHSFSDLADEYGGSEGPYPFGEPREVNVTRNPGGAKWARWHGYDQPGIGVIGSYEGGRYYDTGIYRPSENSKMRRLNRPFDAVGREKIILDIYDLVDPLDGWLDNSGVLVNPAEITVDPVDEEVIQVQWTVEDVTGAEGRGTSFAPIAAGLGPGSYKLSARAFDPTAFDAEGWVRKDKDKFEQTVDWIVVLAALPGDADNDGRVSGTDLIAVQGSFGLAGRADGFLSGDANDDGKVSGTDLIAVQQGFGESVVFPAARIPEPASIVCLGALGLSLRLRSST